MSIALVSVEGYVRTCAEARYGGGDRFARECVAELKRAISVVGPNANEIVLWLEREAKRLHDAVAVYPTDEWSNTQWEVMGQSNACSFTAWKVRVFFGDYLSVNNPQVVIG